MEKIFFYHVRQNEALRSSQNKNVARATEKKKIRQWIIEKHQQLSPLLYLSFPSQETHVYISPERGRG
jgi:spore germination protein YaaH